MTVSLSMLWELKMIIAGHFVRLLERSEQPDAVWLLPQC